MYGWRARIGQIYPAAGLTGEHELSKMAPEGVAIYTTRERNTRMDENLEAVASLLADARIDIIAFNCTMRSLLKGAGYDQDLIRRITEATGILATTTSTAVLEALKCLQINKLVLITPYPDEKNEIETAFLEAHGHHVLAKRGLGMTDNYEQAAVDPGRWYRLAKEMQHPVAEGYFISCAGIQVVEIIDQLEADLRKPVVTSNQAILWDCLRRLGIGEPVPGYGTLLRDRLP